MGHEFPFEFAGRVCTLDRRGFPDPPEQRDENFAQGMGCRVGLDLLTAGHWAFLRYFRKKFVEERTVPLVVPACAANRLRPARLKHLLPAGYHRGACRIAGLPFFG